MLIKRYFLFCSTFASFLALVDFAQSSFCDDDNEMNRQSKGMTTLSLKSLQFVAGGEPVLLSGGIHSFPFKLGLPLGLPSTFLGKHGWVQYFCKAALREETGLTHKNQQVFIIMNPIDLNLEPPILAVRYILYSFLQGQVKMILFSRPQFGLFSTLFKEEVILQSWPTVRSFVSFRTFKTTKISSFPHPSLCDFYLHSILENILANPKIGFNPYNFTKILGDFTYLK